MKLNADIVIIIIECGLNLIGDVLEYISDYTSVVSIK